MSSIAANRTPVADPSVTPTKPTKTKKRPTPQHVRVFGLPGKVLVVPPRQVHHLPDPPPSTEGVAADAADAFADPASAVPKHRVQYLCSEYQCDSAGKGVDGSCPRGVNCPFVHADVSQNVASYLAHELDERRWTSPAAVPHPLLGTARDEPLVVAPPNGRDESVPLRPEYCLKTAVLESDRRPMSLCAHFERTGVCDRGAQCQFVHYVKSLAAAAAASAAASAPVAATVAPAAATTTHSAKPRPPAPGVTVTPTFAMRIYSNSSPTTRSPVASPNAQALAVGATNNNANNSRSRAGPSSQSASPLALAMGTLSATTPPMRRQAYAGPADDSAPLVLPLATYANEPPEEDGEHFVAADSLAEPSCLNESHSSPAGRSTMSARMRMGTRYRHDPYNASTTAYTPSASMVVEA